MKKCKECEKEISGSAKECPNCGKDQRNWVMKHKFLTAIIVIILLTAVGSSGSSDKSSSSSDTGNTGSMVKEEAIVDNKMDYEEVSTTDFIAAFDDNQLAAEKMYKDKGVQLKAKIKNISEDIMGSPFLSLEPTNADEYYFGTNIQCMFKNADDLLSVSNGVSITLQGIVKEQSVGIIVIKDCRIVE